MGGAHRRTLRTGGRLTYLEVGIERLTFIQLHAERVQQHRYLRVVADREDKVHSLLIGKVPAETLLPLDDVLGCLRDTIPNLSRSALHRCLQRHGISRLPVEESKTQRKRFKTYEIGYVHIDSCELRHADGRLVMFLAIDRVSKFTYVEFHECAGKMEGAAFLRAVIDPIASDRPL